ncbi:hypothetical protein, partial [Faecalibaculum rodentium]|uniref:hypothetical protein n=1 Tax=Faecalibaculum rodentium TaxID=1702221 RepID=UPI0027311856
DAVLTVSCLPACLAQPQEIRNRQREPGFLPVSSKPVESGTVCGKRTARAKLLDVFFTIMNL